MIQRECMELIYCALKSCSSIQTNKGCFIFLNILLELDLDQFEMECRNSIDLTSWISIHENRVLNTTVNKAVIYEGIYVAERKEEIIGKLEKMIQKDTQFALKKFMNRFSGIIFRPLKQENSEVEQVAAFIYWLLSYYYPSLNANIITKSYLILSQEICISKGTFNEILFDLTRPKSIKDNLLLEKYQNMNQSDWNPDFVFHQQNHLMKKSIKSGVWDKKLRYYKDKRYKKNILQALAVLLKIYFESLHCHLENNLKIQNKLYELSNFSEHAKNSSHQKIENYDDLALVLYECVESYIKECNREKEKSLRIEFCEKDFEMEGQVKRDSAADWEEFKHKIKPYGLENFDRYLILKKFAETNCYAAEELGDILYFGKVYTVPGNRTCVVKRDFKLAQHYYLIAANADPPLGVAAWSLGYMLTHKNYSKISKEDAELWGEKFFLIAKECRVSAAYHDLAKIATDRAKRLYKEEKKITSQIYHYYEQAVRMLYEAGTGGWSYSWINIGNMIEKDPIFQQMQDDFLKKNPDFVRIFSPLQLYQKAAEYENSEALFECGRIYEENGDLKEAYRYYQHSADLKYERAIQKLEDFPK